MVRDLIPWRRKRSNIEVARTGEDEPFLSLHREMDRLFDAFMHGFGGGFDWPALRTTTGSLSLDVSETDDAFQVTAELPGLAEEDIHLIIEDDVLTIKAEKKRAKDEKKKDYHLVERSFGEIHRSVQLPREINLEEVSANFKNGELTIELPKTPEAKTQRRTIDVSGE